MKPTSAVSRLVAGGGVLAIFGGITLYLLWLSLPWPLVHDAPIMHYVAWRIAHGAIPYRDLFDMNQPGVYLIHLGVLRLFGEGDVGWRLFDLLALGLGSGAVAWFAAPWGRLAAGGGALFFALYHLADGAWQAGQRDFLLCPLLVVAAGGIARFIQAPNDARWASLAGSGLALGVAITIKPHVFVLALGFAVIVLGIALRRRVVAPALIVYLAPLALPPIGVLVWLARVGALRAWREIVFEYLLPLYGRLGRPADWSFFRWHVWIAIGSAVVLSLGAAVWQRRFTARHGIAVVGLGYGLVHFFGQGKGWEYHLYPLAVFAAVLAFSELECALRNRRLVMAVPLGIALVATAGMLGQKGAEAADAEWIWDKERVVRWIVADLRAAGLKPADTVQVLDTTEGGLHALLRLHAVEPTRFLYDFHFFHDTDRPIVQRLRSELVRDLARRPPRFVVVFERGWPAGRFERIESFPELARWLQSSYTVLQHRGGYVIFAKRHDS